MVLPAQLQCCAPLHGKVNAQPSLAIACLNIPHYRMPFARALQFRAIACLSPSPPLHGALLHLKIELAGVQAGGHGHLAQARLRASCKVWCGGSASHSGPAHAQQQEVAAAQLLSRALLARLALRR